MQQLFDKLKVETGDLWQRAQAHPFIEALGDGTLERDKFIHYLKQDYAYLTGYSRAIALATAKAPTLKRMTEYATLLRDTLELEMEMHREFCLDFAIPRKQLETVDPSPICQAYIDFCISTAATGDILELHTALVPCGVGYGEIGRRLVDHEALDGDHPYEGWIYLYGGDEYQKYERWLVKALNEMGADAPESRLPRLTELFRLGCRYEWLFWEMAWRMDGWPM